MNGASAEPVRLPEPLPSMLPPTLPEQRRSTLSEPPAPAPVAPQAFGRMPTAAPLAPVAPRSRTCLVVDDSRVVRKISRRIVEGLGYTVIEVEDGQEALSRCQAAMPDLILLDWDMPVMTGLEFIQQLRALPGNVRPKVVFCTARKETSDIYKGIDAGADEYVSKPFDEASLTAKLQRVGAA